VLGASGAAGYGAPGPADASLPPAWRDAGSAGSDDARGDASPTGAAPRPLLEIRGLRKSFGSLEVLKGIDLVVRRGELVFLIGPSGSGKSTLLRCCNRLEEPSAGSIRVEDIDLMAPGTDINAVRRRIGMVFQSFNLYPHFDALGNVTLALRKVLGRSRGEAEAIGRAALDRVGLADKASSRPGELSGGQQQRVAIARALALEPAMMLFDEPTSALDPELVGSVLAVMRRMRDAGMTMLVVSHEMRFARQAADRIVFMDGGRILEEGPPQKLFESPEHPRVREFLATIEH
jgi:polar amino acid transport system ATP-binding protein